MADDDVDPGGAVFTMIRNASMDDLRFELKRLQQRYDVLERDKKIMEDERELARATYDSSTADVLSRELKAKNIEALKWYEYASSMGQKHRVVLRHLWLEKRALREMKAELVKGMDVIFSSSQTIAGLNRLQTGVLHLQREKESLTASVRRYETKVSRINDLLPVMRKNLQLQKEVFKVVKTSVFGELHNWSTFFQAAKCNIEQHINNYAHKASLVVETMRNEQTERIELSKRFEESEVARNAQDSVIRELKDQLLLTRQQADTEISGLNFKIINLGCQIEELGKENQHLKENSDMLAEKFEGVMHQMQRLAVIHESTQKDLESALSREENLQKDLHLNGNSKDEISLRLKRIQEKVNRMEEDHSKQLQKLESEVLSAKEAHTVALLGKENALKAAEDTAKANEALLIQEIDEWKDKLKTLEEKSSESVVAHRNSTLKLAEQEGLISSMKSTISELRLRQESANRLKLQAEAEVKQRDEMIHASEGTRADLQVQLVEMKKKHSEQTSSKEQEIVDVKAEIARLRLVVQKECQERTELLIQISELKDYIRDNSIAAGNTGGGGSVVKSGSTTYSQFSAVEGLSQNKISSGLVASHTDGASICSDKRLAEAISYSRHVGADEPASTGNEDVWAQKIGQHGSSRKRKSTRGHHR